MLFPVLLTVMVGGISLGDLELVAPPKPRPVARSFTERDVNFVGFSSDESAAAWRVGVRRYDRSGYVDHYTLIKISDTQNNDVMAVFRGSEIWREDHQGRRKSVSMEKLLVKNPEYEHAEPRRLWMELNMTHAFAASEVSPTAFYVSVIPDADMGLDTYTQNGALYVRAREPGPLGYRLVGSPDYETSVALGHYREEPGREATLQAKVTIFASRSKKRIAILNRFEVVYGRRLVPGSYGAVVGVPLPLEQRPETYARQAQKPGRLPASKCRGFHLRLLGSKEPSSRFPQHASTTGPGQWYALD